MATLLLLLCALSVVQGALNPKNVVYAVNCGGPALKTRDGVSYVADTGFTSGISSDYGSNFATFKNTKTPELYQTERYGTDDFSYKVPLSEDGVYTLILKFSEVYFGIEGEKVFDVGIGDVKVITDLDIYAKVGKAAAYDEYVQVELKKGVLKIGGQEVRGGLENNKLKIDFLKASYDNPKINAIVLVRGDKSETDFVEQKAKLETIIAQKEKAKEVRTEVYEDEIQDYEYVENVVEPHKEEASLLTLVFSIPGVILISILALCLVLLLRGGSDKPKKS